MVDALCCWLMYDTWDLTLAYFAKIVHFFSLSHIYIKILRPLRRRAGWSQSGDWSNVWCPGGAQVLCGQVRRPQRWEYVLITAGITSTTSSFVQCPDCHEGALAGSPIRDGPQGVHDGPGPGRHRRNVPQDRRPDQPQIVQRGVQGTLLVTFKFLDYNLRKGHHFLDIVPLTKHCSNRIKIQYVPILH